MWFCHIYIKLCSVQFYNCLLVAHTCKTERMMCSSTANKVIPNRVNTISCTGLTFPRQAPYAIRQPATQKSALMMLGIKR